MANPVGRRSRALDSDDDDSRPNTPASTAPYDAKRMRRNASLDDDDDHSLEEDTSFVSKAALSIRKPQLPAPATGNNDTGPGHQPGAIVRVKLTNFVTYTAAEFFPGPNLNMVIGPNGTGKSTLVCAICLGLGWGPKYLGRAKEPSEFVKHGSREATIEIELKRKSTTRRNPVITRLIKRENNQSTFLINGRQSTGREVQLLANSFNIQIDNLCQFLPQDKVVEFAQLSPIDLLTSTQRAVAGPEMVKYQEDLKKLRASQSMELKDDKEAQARLANLEGRQALQRTEVERVRERAKVKLRLERLEKSRIFLQYQEARNKASTAKARRQAVEKELRHLEAVSAPTLRTLRVKEQYEQRARESKTEREKELKACVRSCDEKTKLITKCDEDMKEQKSRIETEKTGVGKSKEAIAREQSKLRGFAKKKEEAPETFDVTGLTNEIQELRSRANALDDQLNELRQQRDDLKTRGAKRVKDRDLLAAQVESFGSHASQQDEKLKTLSTHTWQAWEWIQKNQDQFSQRVFGPPVVECSLKDPSTADAIESILQQNDFKFITVQNKADFHLLQKQLFGLKSGGGLGLHDVSLRECSIDNLDQYQPPITQEHMEALGLSGWVMDYLQGPNTVLAQLCQERGLHRCGLSSREPTQQQHDDIAKTDVSSYVAGQKVYQFLRRKEYGAAGTSARVQDIRRARYWTDQPVDLGRKAALQRDLTEARGEAQMLHTEFKDVGAQIKKLESEKDGTTQEINTKKEAKEAIQRSRMEYESLDMKIQMSKDVISTATSTMHGVGVRISKIQEEVDSILIAKSEAVLGFAAAARELKAKLESLLEADVILVEATSDLQVAEAQNNEVVEAIANKRAELSTVNDLHQEQHDLAIQIRDKVKTLRNEAERLNNEGDDGFEKLLEHVCKAIQTSDNLEAEIDAEKARLELTGNGSSGIVEEFERRAREIERLRADVQAASESRAEYQRAIEEIRGRWEPRLDGIVAQINDAFADSFARIGCAGQVAVHKASSNDAAECTEENGGMENGLDFEHWAIHISVKFRESEPLSLLDSHRQSGGERAVSTIFYLMALQSLSRAPFRVVDEINQGMDPRNERMVHGRMVDIAAEGGGSQYFLITPKLLSGLKYRRGMTVLCIVSGENVPAARERNDEGDWQDGPKVDFRTFIARARELGLGDAHIGSRRADSGLGMGRILASASPSMAVGA